MGDLFAVIVASFIIVSVVAAPFAIAYLVGYAVGAYSKRNKDE